MDIIYVSVDVTKIDKERLVVGAKGTYVDLVLIPTPDSKYGNAYLVKQNIPKKDMASAGEGVILGNAKINKPKDIPF